MTPPATTAYELRRAQPARCDAGALRAARRAARRHTHCAFVAASTTPPPPELALTTFALLPYVYAFRQRASPRHITLLCPAGRLNPPRRKPLSALAALPLLNAASFCMQGHLHACRVTCMHAGANLLLRFPNGGRPSLRCACRVSVPSPVCSCNAKRPPPAFRSDPPRPPAALSFPNPPTREAFISTPNASTAFEPARLTPPYTMRLNRALRLQRLTGPDPLPSARPRRAVPHTHTHKPRPVWRAGCFSSTTHPPERGDCSPSAQILPRGTLPRFGSL